MLGKIIASDLYSRYQKFYKIFESKNAFNLETATELTEDELNLFKSGFLGIEMYTEPRYSLSGGYQLVNITSPIKSAGNNKYYFSEEKFNRFEKIIDRFILSYSLIMIVFFIILYLAWANIGIIK